MALWGSGVRIPSAPSVKQDALGITSRGRPSLVEMAEHHNGVVFPIYLGAMITLDGFRRQALALPEVDEQLHCGRIAFRRGKTRFAIFDPRKGELALRLPAPSALRDAGIERGLLEPAPGKYGIDGWLAVDMGSVGEPEFARMLQAAHEAAPAPRNARG
jgi:hypothetical protein